MAWALSTRKVQVLSSIDLTGRLSIRQSEKEIHQFPWQFNVPLMCDANGLWKLAISQLQALPLYSQLSVFSERKITQNKHV